MAVLVTVVLLGAAGALPAIAAAGLRPVTVFLAPMVGALLAAFGAAGEFAIGGTVVAWFVALAMVANVAALAICWRFGFGAGVPAVVDSEERPGEQGRRWGWDALTVAVVAASLAWPLHALSVPTIGDDANSIWLLHALLISGGHAVFAAGLENHAYVFSNPDYPPLVPAASALAFKVAGSADLRAGVAVTACLNACGLGVVACGIARAVGDRVRWQTRVVALIAGAAVCLVGYNIAGQYAVDGYADLCWAATATGAVVFGLVLPYSWRNLAVAWLCATMAALTKNEGLTTALVIIALLSVRYVAAATRRPLGALFVVARPGRRWGVRVLVAAVLAVPSLVWTALVKVHGINDAFFKSANGGSVASRVGPTVAGTAHHLQVVPVAAVVTVVGLLTLTTRRQALRLASPGWLWLVAGASLAIVMATYVFGSLPIFWWLSTSVNRTTIFTELVLSAEIALWLVVSASPEVDPLSPRADSAAARPAVEAQSVQPVAVSMATSDSP